MFSFSRSFRPVDRCFVNIFDFVVLPLREFNLSSGFYLLISLLSRHVV